MHDPDLRMIGFYVLRGHDHDKLLALSENEKWAYLAWMELYYEEEEKRMKSLFGGLK